MTVAHYTEHSERQRQKMAASGRINQPPPPVAEEHLVIFCLGNENYAVDIGDVWEINTMQPITHVPRTPHFIEGVINLRGDIIPVMDLRKRLGLHTRTHDRETRIMVIQSAYNRLGLIVDRVREVLKIPASSIMAASELGVLIDEAFIRGVVQRDERLIILLDLQRLLAEDEHESLERLDAAV